MSDIKTIKERIERRTYLIGQLRGQYIGFLNELDSDLIHETCYDLEVLEAEIWVNFKDIRKWDTGGECEPFTTVDHFITRIPDVIICHIKYPGAGTRDFKISLQEPKLMNIRLFDQVYHKHQVLGTIAGNISGYLVHYDEKTVMHDSTALDEASEVGDVKSKETTNKKFSSAPTASFWKEMGEVLQWLAAIVFLAPLVVAGWPLIALAIAAAMFYFAFAIIQPVIRRVGGMLVSLIWGLFLLFFILALINLGNATYRSEITPVIPKNAPEETTTYTPQDTNGIIDSIIRHHRVWNTYNGRRFSGTFWVNLSDAKKSTAFRNSIPVNAGSIEGYNQILSDCYEFDQARISGLYQMFDSIHITNRMDDKAFAETIVSCIQDIPYVLILDGTCNPWGYDDAFIREYLSGGGICRPNTRFGLLTPVEFLASLEGDGDSRALLLFSVLSYYKFDVAILGSTHFRHSVIAINLPYPGVSKMINSKRYVIWETTQPGLLPGIFPSKMADMRYWSVNVLSNQNPVQ